MKLILMAWWISDMNDIDLKKMCKQQLIELASVGFKFKNNHSGKKKEFFQRYIDDIVKRMPKPTLDNLLYELELEAVRREREGVEKSCTEKIDRIWRLVTYHHPKRGRRQLTFKTIQNKLTKAKKAE